MAFGITSTRARAIAFFIPQSGREETLEAAQNSSAPGRGLPCQRPAVHGSNFDLYVAERSLGNFYARTQMLRKSYKNAAPLLHQYARSVECSRSAFGISQRDEHL
ncbi:uncharacterized protein LOC142580992 isoform X2 [Dermacentor variabilis]|uniref:uncharacterized protein LOC142580992 isoform X2 n=1 Tax=Dermacentor variabilis TaxID=34621 RepID=UPI003F5ADFA2